MIRTLSAALVGLCFCVTAGTAVAQKRMPPFRFADGHKQPYLLSQILRNADKRPSFNRDYYRSNVSCGPGCDSSWFVDRHRRIVIEAPSDFVGGSEMIYEIRATLESDALLVVYGPNDGVGTTCSARRYVLSGTRFTPVSLRTPTPCPK